MVETIEEVMTRNPTALSASMTIGDAARTMRAQDIGDVLVIDEDNVLCGIRTGSHRAVYRHPNHLRSRHFLGPEPIDRPMPEPEPV